LFSAFAISLTTASAPPALATSTLLLVLMRTLPSS
jgi:hypothetical protein